MKNSKKNSPMKKIIPSACMLAISAAMLSTSTYAWFSMNTTVTATGMQVKAKAEAGLVISNSQKLAYNATASAHETSLFELVPGSTSDLTNWYHSVSTDPTQANTNQAYEAATQNTNYVAYEFYIRSSAYESLSVQSLDINSITLTGTPSQELSDSLRVGIKLEGDSGSYIYSPKRSSAYTYYVHGSTETGSAHTTSVTSKTSATKSSSSIISIPGNTNDGIKATVYVWFEGEDENCKSEKIVNGLETLNVTVEFGYTAATGA